MPDNNNVSDQSKSANPAYGEVSDDEERELQEYFTRLEARNESRNISDGPWDDQPSEPDDFEAAPLTCDTVNAAAGRVAGYECCSDAEIAEAAETVAPYVIDAEGDDVDAPFLIQVPARPEHRRPVHEAALMTRELPESLEDHRRFEEVLKLCITYDLDGDAVHFLLLDVDARRPFNAHLKQLIMAGDYDLDVTAALNKIERGSALAISNFAVKSATNGKGERETITVPLRMPEILNQIRCSCGEWPRRVGRTLFVHDQHHGIHFFDKGGHAGLFGWMKSLRNVKFKEQENYCKPAEVKAELERTSQRYDSISMLPHEPPIKGIYYGCVMPDPGDGTHLDTLVARFNPATPLDAQLIKAAFVTPGWGGPGGARPVFLMTADSGQGAGKTTLAEMDGYLYGGRMDVSAGEDITALKQRLLTPAVMSQRIAIIDNLKTHKFSWGPFESLITAPTISGKQMYVGEAVCPNYRTWFITVNGADLGKDMAKRCVVIKILQADTSGNWRTETEKYIDQHRTEILADVVAVLRGPKQIERYTRWSDWEDAVLARLPDCGLLQQLILSRQQEVDVDDDEAALLTEHFAAQVRSYRPREADHGHWFIRSATAKTWLEDALGERTDAVTAGRRISQMIKAGRLRHLSLPKSNKLGRGYVWHGPQADPKLPVELLIEKEAKAGQPQPQPLPHQRRRQR